MIATTPGPSPGHGAIRGRMSILVVDDQPDSLLAMEAALEGLGEDVVKARTGREALRALLARDFAVIILDVRMPGLDGFETASLIRERDRSRGTPIIFVTGYEEASSQIMRGYASGAVDYLVKPVSPDIMRSKVQIFVDLARQRELLESTNRRLEAASREIRAAEERYRTLIEQLPPGVFLYRAALEPAGTPVYVSPHIRDVLGYRPDEWLADGAIREQAVHVDDRALADAGRPAAHAPPGSHHRARYRMVARDGSVRWVQEEAVVVAGEGGAPGFLQGMILDVTDRVEADRLRTQKAEAEAASTAKSRFLANMSHELRTPLNSVIGFANLLLKRSDGELTEAQLDYSSRIAANGRHLLGLINQVLDLAKIESGHVEVVRVPVDLRALISSTVAQIEGQLADRPLRLQVEVPDGVAPLVTDEGKLRQILVNLVGNAVKFTDRGTVTVRVVAGGDGRTPAAIEVEDTGIGIPSSQLDDIFRSFEQGRSENAGRREGSGLGLAICRSLAEVLGWRLEVRSRLGDGSTFTVVLGEPRGPGAAT